MWTEATRVAILGFSVVFITLWILAASVKIMTYFCKLVDKKGGKKS
jgi:Na+-transporting methylmalonyl-CoA/oxaloacetate decarboxylase gamma subunit